MSAATAAGDRRRISIGLPAGCDEGPKASGLMVLDDGTVIDPASGEILEAETESLRVAKRKAGASEYYASALADALVGEHVTLGLCEDGDMVLLGEDGRVLVEEPGQGYYLRYAALLLLESQTPWTAVGKAKDGRIFGVGGAGYCPGVRFSPAYQRKQAARSRKVAREFRRVVQNRLEAVRYRVSRDAGGKVLPVAWTMTTPTLDPAIVSGVSEAKEEERLFLAWTSFRKTDLFKAIVFACFRGYEITRKVHWDGVLTFHPHFHLLSWAKYADQILLARTWWRCLKAATQEVYKFDLDDLYDDEEKDEKGRTALDRAISACLYVQVVKKRVKDRGKVRDEIGHREGPTSLEDAIQETMKYTTKADEIACYKVDPEDPRRKIRTGLPTGFLRTEIERRSPRAFERLGAARSKWEAPDWCEWREGITQSRQMELVGEAAKRASCSLDTPPISDGEEEKKKRETLRSLMHTLDLHRWLQIASRRAFSSLEHLEKGLQAKGFWVPALAGGPPG